MNKFLLFFKRIFRRIRDGPYKKPLNTQYGSLSCFRDINTAEPNAETERNH
jgi:hypothetical protein